MKFRINHGIHIGPDINGKEHMWRARRSDDPPEWQGDIIETKQDLRKHDDADKARRKFEILDTNLTPATQAPAKPAKPVFIDLSAMTFDQLKAHAEAEEIPLGANVKSKDEALKVIRAAMQPVTA